LANTIELVTDSTPQGTTSTAYMDSPPKRRNATTPTQRAKAVRGGLSVRCIRLYIVKKAGGLYIVKKAGGLRCVGALYVIRPAELICIQSDHKASNHRTEDQIQQVLTGNDVNVMRLGVDQTGFAWIFGHSPGPNAVQQAAPSRRLHQHCMKPR
jgi:hypothetical protein